MSPYILLLAHAPKCALCVHKRVGVRGREQDAEESLLRSLTCQPHRNYRQRQIGE